MIDKTRPNVVVILVDDLGWGDLSCYGAPDLRTPCIDKIAASGMKFENFYANSSVCSPSRASLLTGRYPGLVGVPGVIRTYDWQNYGYFDPAAVTLGDMFRSGGYSTALIGKWHLGLESPNTPNERGFDYFRGFLGDMMDDYYTHLRHGNNYMRRDSRPVDPDGHATDLFTEWGVQYLREKSKSNHPFFLYLAYNAPHTPIQPPEEWHQRVRERHPDASGKRSRLIALIEHLDHGIGRIMDTLRETGLADSTMVVFTSDNGGDLPAGARIGPWRGSKTHMYDGGLRVPMAAAWPGVISEGSVTDARALIMDIFPTVMAACDLDIQHEVDGSSFLSILKGETDSLQPRDEYFLFLQNGMRDAVRIGNDKLVNDDPDENGYELFDLKADPFEQHDLSSVDPVRYNTLYESMQSHLERVWATRWRNSSQLKKGDTVMKKDGRPNPRLSR